MSGQRRMTTRAALAYALALGIGAHPVRAASMGQSNDIVVVARKFNGWRAVLIVEQGNVVRCRVVKSIGNEALDAQGCDAMKQCFETARPQLEAANGRALAATARKRRLAQINREMQTCFRSVFNRFSIAPTDE